MNAPAFDAQAHARAMRANGFWVDTTVDETFADAVATHPAKTALVACRADQPVMRRFSYAELDPDIFGTELERPAYRNVERIAAVLLDARFGPA